MERVVIPLKVRGLEMHELQTGHAHYLVRLSCGHRTSAHASPATAAALLFHPVWGCSICASGRDV